MERIHLKVLENRLLEPRHFIQVVSGPRQTGKTTLVRQLLEITEFPGMYESADNIPAAGTTWLEQVWQRARLRMKSEKHAAFILVIDEIQKIPLWSSMVKKCWDQDTFDRLNLKVVLTGSSRLLLQSGLTESLAGRFETLYMGHWSPAEMHAAFGWDTETWAWFGGYPGSASLIGDENRWKKYITDSLIETTLSRDILMLTRIDKPALLKRLFDQGCLYTGQILSMTKILGLLQDAGNTTTLSHYLQVLHSAGLLGGLEKYAADVIRKRASVPKFQVHNNALLSAQHPQSFSDVIRNPQEWGRIVESAIGVHLLNACAAGDCNLYYWREGDLEVDFVLEKQGKLVGIEVKSAGTGNGRGMAAFCKRFPHARPLLVGNTGIPWQEFLMMNPLEVF